MSWKNIEVNSLLRLSEEGWIANDLVRAVAVDRCKDWIVNFEAMTPLPLEAKHVAGAVQICFDPGLGRNRDVTWNRHFLKQWCCSRDRVEFVTLKWMKFEGVVDKLVESALAIGELYQALLEHQRAKSKSGWNDRRAFEGRYFLRHL